MTTKWRHTASRRVRLHTHPDCSEPEDGARAFGDLHATNAPHTPLFNLAHFSGALAREQCARATAEAAPSRPKAALPAPSLKPSAAHGQIGRSPAEFARGGSSDQPRPQWAFGSDESTHQLSSIAQVHAMAAGCFHRLSSAATSRRSSKGTIVPTTMNFCTSAMYHMQRPQLCAGHGQRHRPIKVGMAMRQLKLRSSAGPSSRRPDTSHATWTRARPAWPAPGRWLGQRARWWAAGGAGATIRAR